MMRYAHPDSALELAGERFMQMRPHPALASFIESYALVEMATPTQSETFGRLVPDGIIKLVFHYGSQFMQATSTAPETQERSFIHAHLPTFVDICPTGGIGFVAVHFFAHGLAAFTKVPVTELGQYRVTPGELWGKKGEELQTRILEAGSGAERFQLFDQFFLRQLQAHEDKQVLASAATRWIWERQGQVSVKKLAEAFGKSVRTMERLFATQLGASPKYLARVFRIHHLIHQYQQQSELTLMDLSYLGGYYDQSHFHSDFQRLVGVSPKLLLNRKEVPKILFLNQSLTERMQYHIQ